MITFLAIDRPKAFFNILTCLKGLRIDTNLLALPYTILAPRTACRSRVVQYTYPEDNASIGMEDQEKDTSGLPVPPFTTHATSVFLPIWRGNVIYLSIQKARPFLYQQVMLL